MQHESRLSIYQSLSCITGKRSGKQGNLSSHINRDSNNGGFIAVLGQFKDEDGAMDKTTRCP